MYAQVVVLTYQPPEIDSYTYKIPKNLEKEVKVGQLVEVPFGKRTPLGIVIQASQKDSPLQRRLLSKKIKPITDIIMATPILLTYQIELLKWMSAYYIAPMVNCLKIMLPALPGKLPKAFSYSSSDPALRESREVSLVNGKFSTSSNSKQSQTLVLVPSITRIPEAMSNFPKAKNYAIYHNELKPAEKLATFARILNGGVDYIFGSRSAIFAPCPNFKKIIIYNEHETTYKDERSPYYDTLTIAEKIAQITKVEIKIVDPAPKITTYFNWQKNISINSQNTKFKIISLEKERLGGNYSPLALDTEEFIKRVVKSKKNALLYINKKKESGYLFCKSCKNKQFLETQVDICPNCQSSDIFLNSLNVYSLAQTVKKIVYHYPVNVIEQKQKSYPLQNSIDIATSFVFYSQPLKKYELVIFTFADSITQVADWKTEEKLYQTIIKLKSLLSQNGLLVIQTYNPQNQTIFWAARGDYKSFYNTQINNRKLLSYPPFALLIKLTLKGKNKQEVESEANRLITQLQSTTQPASPTRLNSARRAIQLLGPYASIFFPKIPTFNIIIKYKLNSYKLAEREKAIKDLKPILKDLKNVQVTVEPEFLN